MSHYLPQIAGCVILQMSSGEDRAVKMNEPLEMAIEIAYLMDSLDRVGNFTQIDLPSSATKLDCGDLKVPYRSRCQVSIAPSIIEIGNPSSYQNLNKLRS